MFQTVLRVDASRVGSVWLGVDVVAISGLGASSVSMACEFGESDRGMVDLRSTLNPEPDSNPKSCTLNAVPFHKSHSKTNFNSATNFDFPTL
jgi:hypothetical protein